MDEKNNNDIFVTKAVIHINCIFTRIRMLENVFPIFFFVLFRVFLGISYLVQHVFNMLARVQISHISLCLKNCWNRCSAETRKKTFSSELIVETTCSTQFLVHSCSPSPVLSYISQHLDTWRGQCAKICLTLRCVKTVQSTTNTEILENMTSILQIWWTFFY